MFYCFSMDDDNTSWNSDARYSRDCDRESTYPTSRRTSKLSPLGSVKISYEPRPPCCSVDHEAIKSTPDWSALKLIGRMPSYDEPGKPDLLELRNCGECHTTLAKPIFARTEEALDLLRREGLL